MAPQFTDADFQVLISCLKNSSTKLTPNFDEVAKECGLKDSKAAYMRHWSMLRKLGLTGTKPQSKNAKKETSATPKKRGAARESAENGNDGDGDGDGEEEPETPSKKVKRECA